MMRDYYAIASPVLMHQAIRIGAIRSWTRIWCRALGQRKDMTRQGCRLSGRHEIFSINDEYSHALHFWIAGNLHEHYVQALKHLAIRPSRRQSWRQSKVEGTQRGLAFGDVTADRFVLCSPSFVLVGVCA